MPEEVLAIALVSIAAGTLLSLLRMILAYKERGRDGSATTSGSSLTTGELERMMTRAVESATEPLRSKIADLEDQIRHPRALGAPGTGALIDVEAKVQDEEPSESTVRRSVRS